MQVMLACTSHSPLLDFPARQSRVLEDIRRNLDELAGRIAEFNPDLIVLFGNDHYGGHQMAAMPAFCVGVEATAIADVGGRPGKIPVPRDIAIAAVNALRKDDVDVAVSYAMEVDHGFSQVLGLLTHAVDKYPVLPIFVSCIQPPFVPFHRARKLGEAVGNFIPTLGRERVLIIGTGGLAHNPEVLFPPIDKVSDEWKPFILHGTRQADVPRQSWIEYEIEAHIQGASMLIDDSVPLEDYGMIDGWDKAFLVDFSAGNMTVFDHWEPERVVDFAGIGAMETLSWIAAGAAMKQATGRDPEILFQECCREVGVGFGIAYSGPHPATPQSPLPLIGEGWNDG